MENKKIIIPIIFVIGIAAIVGLVFFMNYKSNQFTIPGRSEMEKEIKKLGYDVGEFDKSLMEFAGIQPFTKIYAVSKKTGESGSKETEDVDISFTFFEYNDNSDAAKTMSDYYLNAQVLKKRNRNAGKIKYYYDEKNNRAYAVYDIKLDSDGFIENYVMSVNSGNLLSGKKVDYLYGGIYMDGKRVVSITTTNRLKAYDIGKVLDDLRLPKP